MNIEERKRDVSIKRLKACLINLRADRKEAKIEKFNKKIEALGEAFLPIRSIFEEAEIEDDLRRAERRDQDASREMEAIESNGMKFCDDKDDWILRED